VPVPRGAVELVFRMNQSPTFRATAVDQDTSDESDCQFMQVLDTSRLRRRPLSLSLCFRIVARRQTIISKLDVEAQSLSCTPEAQCAF